MNELIFIAHICFIAITVLGALRLGKEALISFICLMCILANIFVSKQIGLFGFHVTTADSLSIGASLGLNLLQEYYGRTVTRKAIWISFAAGMLVTCLSQIHLLYAPSIFDTTQMHYVALFGIIPRIMLASFTTYIIVQNLEAAFYAWLQKIMPQALIARNLCSIAICQLIDTVLFSFLGLFGAVEHIWHIIFMSYLIKVIVLSTATPFLWFCKKIIPSPQALPS